MTQLPACRFNAKDIFSAFILVQRPVLVFRMVKRYAHVPGYNKLNTLLYDVLLTTTQWFRWQLCQMAVLYWAHTSTEKRELLKYIYYIYNIYYIYSNILF